MWEPILLAKNFARNSGSQTQQKAFKIVVILVLNMLFTNLVTHPFTNKALKRSFFLWQEILPVTIFFNCGRKFLPATRSLFLWQEISFDVRKFLSVTRNFFWCQEISSCDRTFLPLTRNFFLWQEISSCDKKFLSVTRNL